MRTVPPKTTQYMLRLTQEELDLWREAAKRNNMTVAEYVRKAVDFYTDTCSK